MMTYNLVEPEGVASLLKVSRDCQTKSHQNESAIVQFVLIGQSFALGYSRRPVGSFSHIFAGSYWLMTCDGLGWVQIQVGA